MDHKRIDGVVLYEETRTTRERMAIPFTGKMLTPSGRRSPPILWVWQFKGALVFELVAGSHLLSEFKGISHDTPLSEIKDWLETNEYLG